MYSSVTLRSGGTRTFWTPGPPQDRRHCKWQSQR